MIFEILMARYFRSNEARHTPIDCLVKYTLNLTVLSTRVNVQQFVDSMVSLNGEIRFFPSLFSASLLFPISPGP